MSEREVEAPESVIARDYSLCVKTAIHNYQKWSVDDERALTSSNTVILAVG